MHGHLNVKHFQLCIKNFMGHSLKMALWKKAETCRCYDCLIISQLCLRNKSRVGLYSYVGLYSCIHSIDYWKPNVDVIMIIIINIKDWTLWSVPSSKLQLLSPTFLRSSNCSPSLWSAAVWFQRDSVLWHSLQVLKPVPFAFIYLVQYACNLQFAAYVVVCLVVTNVDASPDNLHVLS